MSDRTVIEIIKPSAGNFYEGSWRVLVELSSLIEWDIDQLNDWVAEAVTGSVAGLTDIEYSVSELYVPGSRIALLVEAVAEEP